MFALLLLLAPPSPEVKVVIPKTGGPAVVEITGIEKDVLATVAAAKPTPAEWSKMCRVKVAGGTPAELDARPAVAGSWSATADGLRFEPQFPLTPGMRYRVMW